MTHVFMCLSSQLELSRRVFKFLLWSEPKSKPSSKVTRVQLSCRFTGKQTMDKAATRST